MREYVAGQEVVDTGVSLRNKSNASFEEVKIYTAEKLQPDEDFSDRTAPLDLDQIETEMLNPEKTKCR